MNRPQPHQQQQVVSAASLNLPSGVENVSITYNYRGIPSHKLTLEQKARRKLLIFAVILLVLCLLVIVITSVFVVQMHFLFAYIYIVGILVSMHLIYDGNKGL